jgi:predicted DNA-binding transcriptional regulator YafY
VFTALLEQRRFKARYRRRKDRKIKDYVVNPLGLVIRPPLSYLVCSFRDYDDVMRMVLHRMTKAELLDEPRKVPEGFNLDRYIREGGFGFPVTKGTIRLVALFEEQAALPL